METKRPIYTIPAPSTSFTQEAFLDCSGTTPTIRYAFETNEGECYSGIKFVKVAAFRKRSERCCTAWHIEGAYDVLVEVVGSSWAVELGHDVPELYRADWKPRHFMIYLDSVGCFEFLAHSWEPLPETPVAPHSPLPTPRS